jgi:hypothetical protein
MRWRRALLWSGAGLAIVLLLLLGTVLILTQTDWGRERVRRFAVDRIERTIEGRIEIGRLEGNLLGGVRVIYLRIEDPEGQPLLVADTLATRFSLRGLLRQRIDLLDVRLVRPIVLLDKKPDRRWNYERIFRIDPDVTVEPRRPGWGDWVALRDVEIVDGRLTVRSAWRPSEELSPAEREEVVRRAQGAVEVVMRGRPSAHTLADLQALIADEPRMHFGGSYTQGELASLYAQVHFVWSVDYTDEGLNSDWLLPNRIYEGSFFNTPAIAERRKAAGAWLADKRAGLIVDDPVFDTVRRLTALTPEDYHVLEQGTRDIGTQAIAFDREACRSLVAALAGTANGAACAYRVAPAG